MSNLKSNGVDLSTTEIQQIQDDLKIKASLSKRGLSNSFVIITAIANAGGDTTPFIPPGDYNPTNYSEFLSAIQSATSGKIIRIPPRTDITITTQLPTIPVGVSIIGSGASRIISGYTPASNTSPSSGILQLTSTSEGINGNQSIYGIEFVGNNYQAASAIYAKGRSNVTVKNCLFKEFNYNAVTFNGRGDETDGPATTKATGNSISNCVARGCSVWIGSKVSPYGYASGIVQFGSQSGFVLKDSIIVAKGRGSTNNGYGVKLYRLGYNDGAVIDNCTIQKNVDDGTAAGFEFSIESWNDCGLTIQNCTLEGWPDINGARPGNGYTFGMIFKNNTCGTGTTPALASTAAVCGVELECASPAGGAPCSDIYIEDNFFNAVKFAVYIYQKSGTGTQKFTNVFIRNNRCLDTRLNETIAAVAEGGTQNWRVTGNTIRKTASGPFMHTGIKLPHRGNNLDWFIAANVIDGGSNSPVSQDAVEGGTTSNLTIRDNIFFNAGNSNVPLLVSSPTNYVLTGNTIEDPLWNSSTSIENSMTGLIGADVTT